MDCPSAHWIGFPGGPAPKKTEGEIPMLICIIPYKQQAACCDGYLTKVRVEFAYKVLSLGVEVWTIGK